jgi:hypothetical protein
MPFADIAEKQLCGAFECFVGNNEAFPATARSTQRKRLQDFATETAFSFDIAEKPFVPLSFRRF